MIKSKRWSHETLPTVAAPAIHYVTSLRDYTQLVEQLMETADAPLWYRGCGDASYALVPSLYRHPTTTDVTDLVKLEEQLLSRFQERGMPYFVRSPASVWEFLFLMQHVGVPTRLLDWTENPFIALYFALVASESLRVGGVFVKPAAVWVLNPGAWNTRALTHLSFAGGVLSVADPPLNGYVPSANLDAINSEPVALYGVHNSPRIVAQRGVFTIFGKNSQPMETMYDGLGFPADSLIQVVVPAGSIEALRKSVFSIGYTESVIYPDLDGLAREMKRSYGFVS